MIWRNGRFYLYEGWAKRKDGTSMQRTGRYPGYVQLREFGTDNIVRLRSDVVMLDFTVTL